MFCTPSIEVDGRLRAGETPSCYCFGHIRDPEPKLLRQLEAHDCDACGLHKYLEPALLAQVTGGRVLLTI